jgi:polysaccharide pyruvyl transferase WcaK-like protein
MRGHGQIIPIGFNVPVIALCNHFKHLGLMEKLGINEYSISINDNDFKDKLMSLIYEIEKNKNTIKNKLKRINSKLEKETKECFDIITKRVLSL